MAGKGRKGGKSMKPGMKPMTPAQMKKMHGKGMT